MWVTLDFKVRLSVLHTRQRVGSCREGEVESAGTAGLSAGEPQRHDLCPRVT
jgi:hypothetical protein